MASTVNREVPQDFLRSCLVEGDPAQEKRIRRNKRRALVASIVFQFLVVTALLLLPLFSKGENIAARGIITPLPPYGLGRAHAQRNQGQRLRHPVRPFHDVLWPTRIPGRIVTQSSSAPRQIEDDNSVDCDICQFGDPHGDPHGLFNSDSIRGPKPPEPPNTNTPAHVVRRAVSAPVQAAMLIHRVEPIYPALAIQIRREGRVELHAIIATDGTVQSLEVLSGDPLLVRSSLEAVREWRYRPTMLNGQAIEVDTHITVIYTLTH